MELHKFLGKILQPLSKILRKILGFGFLFCVILGNLSFGVDYTDYSLPSTITLNGGQRQDTITSSKGNGQATTIGYNRNPHLTINGTAGSQYTLTIADSTTTFYSGGFSVASGIQSALISAHTLAIQSGSVSVGNGANFRVVSSGNTINAQGSEYGGESKVRFSRGSSLQLNQNATADFSNANFFIHDGSTNLLQGANLKISVTKAIRFQNEFVSNGGIANLNGSVYNVGGAVGIQNTTSTFTINGGNVSVSGNFYNGLESKDMSVDNTGSVAGGFNTFDSAFGGGGNLIINGGNLSITGALISQMGGTSIRDGGIYDAKSSTISIYGGTLSTTNGVQNRTGSTITIGADNNGKLGQIIGNVSNNGTFIIDASGASDGNHTFITGTLSGSAPTLRNGNTEFASSNINGGNLAVSLNNDKIASFTHALSPNQSATLNTLGNKIYTTNGASTASLTQLAQNLNQDIFSTFVSSPFAIISYLKSSLDSSLPPNINRPKSTNKSNALSLSLIGSGLSLDTSTQGAKSAFGGSGGIKISFAKDLLLASLSRTHTLPAILTLNAGYTYTALKTSSQSSMLNQDTSLNAQTAGIEAIFLLAFADKRFSISTNLGGFMSFLEASRLLDSSLIATKSQLKSSFGLYQVSLDSIFSYDFASFVSQNSGLNVLSPYVGLHQSVNILPSFAESSDEGAISSQIRLKSNDYTAYHLGIIAGVKYSFLLSRFANNQFSSNKDARLNAKVQYEYLAYHSQKSLDFAYIASQNAQNPQNTQNLSFGMPLAHKLNANLGVEKDFANGLNLGLEITFSTLLSSPHTNPASPEIPARQYYFYGANATLGYRF
ncbi:hypothetical protein [Helicobacter sp. T3_23-1059]